MLYKKCIRYELRHISRGSKLKKLKDIENRQIWMPSQSVVFQIFYEKLNSKYYALVF